MQTALAVEDPPGSRLFIVCGRSVEADVLQAAFRPYGIVQNVKVIREKGVAYVKFDKASSAALAMESLNGAILNNGRGPKLKVLLAEAPTPRGLPQSRQMSDQELSSDPDNIPPRSRLFIVVPKTADVKIIQEEMSQFADLEYCKTDLIASKGVVFCKFSKASSALRALEEIVSRSMIGGYKVKAMLAEPKTKRVRPEMSVGLFTPGKLDYGMGMGVDPAGNFRLASSSGLGGFAFDGSVAGNMPVPQQGLSVQDYGALQGLSNSGIGFAGLQGDSSGMEHLGHQVNLGFAGLGNLNPVSTPEGAVTGQLNNMGFNSSGRDGSIGSGTSSLSTATFPVNYMGIPSPGPSPPLSRQRLFVVLHKSVSEDMVGRLFRSFPGMEYCDLKRDKATGKSKGYCYVNYSTPEAAAQAIADVNGMEFPPGSGYRIKVMYAEALGVRRPPRSPLLPNTSSALSLVHSPLNHVAQDMQAVQESLSGMSLPGVDQQNGRDQQLRESTAAAGAGMHLLQSLLCAESPQSLTSKMLHGS